MKYGSSDHAIIHGEALNNLKDIPDASVDLIFADPPYNIGKKFGNFEDAWPTEEEYIAWCKEWIDECIRVLKESGSFYVMTSTQAMPYLDIYIRKKMEVLSRIVWSYDSSGMQAKKHYGSMYEPILFSVKNKKKYNFNSENILVEAKTGSARKLIDYRGAVPKPYNTKKVPGNVWDIPRVRYRMDEYEEHPSQKPEVLLERIILASTNEGDVVVDPFSGTFTTSAVAKRLNRKSVGIEQNIEYVKIGLRRVLHEKIFEGQELEPIKKNNARKNMKGIKNYNNNSQQDDLFNVDS